MRSLLLTRHPPFPPLRSGDFEYSRHILASLSARGATQVLAYRHPQAHPSADDTAIYALLDRPRRARWKSVLSLLPNVAYREVSSHYLDHALRLAPNMDAVFIDFISMFWCVPALVSHLRRGTGRPAIIVINHNHERSVRRQMLEAQRGWLRLPLAIDIGKAHLLEEKANRLADGFLAITETDFDTFTEMTGHPGQVVYPGYAGLPAPERPLASRKRVTILGNYEAHHKRLVIERVLAALQAADLPSDIEINIVGGGPAELLMTRHPNFKFHGFVEDLSQFLADTRLGIIADDIGGGFKLRALTYGFHRVPLLALDQAMEGMGFNAGIHYMGASSTSDLARMIPHLIEDEPSLCRLRQKAFELCTKNYRFGRSGAAIENLVTQIRGNFLR